MSISFLISGGEDIAIRLGHLQYAVQQGLIDPKLGTLPKQAQLLTSHCMSLTPPRNKEQGEKAVARDIRRVIKGRSTEYLEHVIKVSGTQNNVRQHLTNKRGETYLVDIDRIDPTGSEIPAWHANARDARGRVLRAVSKSNDTTIGRWKADNILWAPFMELRDYVAKKQAMVGYAKAGWLRGYYSLGGERVADYVMRHSGRAPGYINKMLATDNPSIEVRNLTGWGKYRSESDRIVAAATRARAVAMKNYFEKMMHLASEGIATPWQRLRAKAALAA